MLQSRRKKILDLYTRACNITEGKIVSVIVQTHIFVAFHWLIVFMRKSYIWYNLSHPNTIPVPPQA